MTKEEILRREYEKMFGSQKYDHSVNRKMNFNYVSPAMDEYAKQIAIAFAEWLSDHPLLLEPSSGKGEWIGVNFEVVSSATLFEQFLTETSI